MLVYTTAMAVVGQFWGGGSNRTQCCHLLSHCRANPGTRDIEWNQLKVFHMVDVYYVFDLLINAACGIIQLY